MSSHFGDFIAMLEVLLLCCDVQEVVAGDIIVLSGFADTLRPNPMIVPLHDHADPLATRRSLPAATRKLLRRAIATMLTSDGAV